MSIASSLLLSLLILVEDNYQRAVQYTINTAESDMEIVHSMNEYGFELTNSFDEITETDKFEAFFNNLSK